MPMTEALRRTEEKKFWDGYAVRYDRFIKKLPKAYERIVEIAAGHINKDTDVLEIASGTGVLSYPLAPYCRSLTACDLSEQMIRIANGKLNESGISNLTFEVHDAYNLPYDDERFDFVLASNTLHVMMEPRRALTSIKKVVKKDGIVFLPTYCHGQNLLSRTNSRIMSLSGFRVYSKWTAASFLSLIESCGFRVMGIEIIRGSIPLVLPIVVKES